MYGKPVHGHVNLTFIYHLHGADEVVHEHMQVSEAEHRQTEVPNRLNPSFLFLLQIDGTADFTFDLLAYHHMEKSNVGMFFYDGHMDDQSVTVLVQVTEQLTGNTATATTSRVQCLDP